MNDSKTEASKIVAWNQPAEAPLVGARVAVGPYGAGPSPALAVASSGR